MNKYDVMVIGAGPGGYVAAIRAAQSGKKTAIVDREWLGGTCLNVGCIPSKALLKNAEVARLLRERGRDFGFGFENLSLDYGSALKRSRQVSDRLTKGISYLMKKNNIEFIHGHAEFLEKDSIRVQAKDGTSHDYKASDIIIATGSTAINLPGMEPDGDTILTFRDAILQDKLPGRVVIIGGGAIGVEFATIWGSYGVDVTIVEMLPRILPLEDEEVSKELTRALTREGIHVLTDARVEKVVKKAVGLDIQVRIGDDDQTLTSDQILVAVGFQPNSNGLNLEVIEVETSPKGHVLVDDRMSTNVTGVWAIGDVTGKLLLAHVASAQAMLCVDAINGKEIDRLDYRMMPRATYSHPQVASFGFTERQSIEAGMDVKIGKFPFQANGKSLGMGESNGFVKILTERNSGRIIGVHMIGPDVSELLPELTLAQRNSLTVTAVMKNIHAHPTLGEAIQETAHLIEGLPVHL
ncbi:MAG: dihydrolipoyl dehydrogenase [Anaerolineaceae bacterium]|nr:dihydrolipoyl dehydrogenase [Anaerolineaceae bacterium]MBN2677118.1 dihydrolipoyl dehydrogenase [Anaerolineaceae bacterium]